MLISGYHWLYSLLKHASDLEKKFEYNFITRMTWRQNELRDISSHHADKTVMHASLHTICIRETAINKTSFGNKNGREVGNPSAIGGCVFRQC